MSIKLFTREELLPLARSHPEVLVDIILALQERLVQLEQRVQELEAQLARNSSNSGKPPSSDGLSKPGPKSLREPSGRKPGGQPGHPGHTLQRVKTPNHIEVHRLENCPQCGGRGLGRKPVMARHLGRNLRRYFRADAAFANPEIYEYLEAVQVAAKWNDFCLS